MNKKTIAMLLMSATGFALQGCAPSSYIVKEPTPSNISYVQGNVGESNTASINDSRNETAKTFSYGVLKADLMLNGAKLDPIKFLKENTAKELSARGIDFNLNDSSDVNIDIKKLEMRNHRTNAYTPFITLTMLSADVKTDAGNERIGVFVKRGKVPVWSFDEIIEPTLNEPLALLVKEFSAKLNSKLYGAKMSDNDLIALVEKISSGKPTKYTYLDVYQLGFSNNDNAIPHLLELSKSDDEYIRLAAISSLGTIGAKQHLDYLKELSTSAETWTDRAMSLKAIGDLGTDEAIAFLEKAKVELQNEKERERVWSNEIIDLYL